ncbi:MAG: hypothetical protein RSA79_01490 [Oscillospiraceae bacterium]
MGLWGEYENKWYRISEYYYNSRLTQTSKTDEEYYVELTKLCENKKINAIVIDPSAASFIECIRRHNNFKVIPAKNDVLQGIQRVCDALNKKEIFINQNCFDTIREFETYSWQNGFETDRPKKENDHAMDDIRYFVGTILQNNLNDDFFVFSAQR